MIGAPLSVAKLNSVKSLKHSGLKFYGIASWRLICNLRADLSYLKMTYDKVLLTIFRDLNICTGSSWQNVHDLSAL